MKVLFVCKGNVGRSQIAEAVFNKLSKHKSFSAGIEVNENEGQKIKDIPLANLVIKSMKKEGIDISENTRKQFKLESIPKFDKIIVMAERESVPKYLLNRQNVEFWDIKNPNGVTSEEHDKIVEQIKNLVEEFIKKNNLTSSNAIRL